MTQLVARLIFVGIAFGITIASCAPASAPHQPPLGTFVGRVGQHDVYTFTVDGVHCIALDRYNSMGLSCDWPKP